MRIHPIALGVLLAAGCSTQNQDTAAPPTADTLAEKQPTPSEPHPDPKPPVATTVPAQFQGAYAADADACTSPGNPSQLTIDASTIAFHESSGDIITVEGSGNQLDITARLTGEGETRDASYSFGLSNDGQTLTDSINGMARVRCD